MTSELTGLSARSQQQWEAYLTAQVKAGIGGQTLVDELVAGGYSSAEARTMVSRAVQARQGKLGVTLGCSVLLLLGGLSTFLAPVHTQDTRWFWVGAIICGPIGIVYSIVRLAKTR
jgi:uncharacterized membrane protein